MPSKIRRRGKDSYHFFVPNGYDANGKQKGFEKTVHAANDTEAEKLYDLFKADCLHGKVLAAGTKKMTLIQFFDYYKEHYSAANHEETTKAYNDNLFQRIKVVLGPYRIDQIKPHHILDFFKQISADDISCKDGPLNGNTINKYYILLNTLFKTAVKWKFLTENVMNSIDRPKTNKPHKKLPTDTELTKILQILDSEPLEHRLWFMIAFGRGLRREEIFGLKWGDLNFKTRKMEINRAIVYVPGKPLIEKDTKTDNSYRVVAMPQFLVAMFTAWEAELRARVKKRNKRKKVLSIEDSCGPDKWVFQRANGDCRHPCSFTTFMRRFYMDNGLAKVSPHLLRHMSGSYLLRQGIDLARISADLGHGDKAFTMRTYIHELDAEKDKSADAMDAIVDSLTPVSDEIKKGQA
ncbi:site-specific integrase [Sporomusa sp. KB1]|jgi:integrase|uniref:tyrosine-type recombinase/integrase n=1 Tax=Sporomusa sp. KB1 TaxID=943346 RepID=UPI0011AAC2EC|nr:site-specific integrase [Sporomusa sp. KB1]TWH49632.1 site-specific recombinase XerD [Sporomusa sp. KB1]